MELWIRSQNRKLLCRPNKIFIDEYFEENAYGRFEIRSDWGALGIYTEQRALEVLDEIQKILMPPMLINSNEGFIICEDDSMHIINPTYKKIEQPSIYVYEMPKE